jgi:Tfp pilus assembly protein FimT
MASTINASNSGFGGIVSTGDSSGQLALQAAGTTAVTINTSGAIGVGSTPSFGTSGQLLTSAGSSAAPTWTTVSSGGMTLLGTLTTTSGTTQTLSGLTLTNYKFLQISFNNVGFTSGSATELQVAGVKITASTYATTSTAIYGVMNIDLSNGAVGGNVLSGYIPTGSTNTIYFNAGSNPIAGNIQILNATTSIAFSWGAGNTFTNGTIKVYGVA